MRPPWQRAFGPLKPPDDCRLASALKGDGSRLRLSPKMRWRASRTLVPRYRTGIDQLGAGIHNEGAARVAARVMRASILLRVARFHVNRRRGQGGVVIQYYNRKSTFFLFF